MTKTVAITGATGFVGGAMARHFLKNGWQVLAFGRRDSIQLEGDYRYIQWDITTGTISIDEPVHTVIHSAAYVNDWGRYEDFYQTNVTGTQNVLDSFPDVEHSIHISSSSVYDPTKNKHNIDETFPYAEQYLNHYGETKMLSEKVVLEANRPNCAILRPHAVYGAGDTTILPRLLRAHRGNFLLGIGDGNNKTNLTYIDNLCQAAQRVTETQVGCEIFNIVDEHPVRLATILETINTQLDLNARIVYIPTPLALAVAHLSTWFYSTFNIRRQPTLTPYRVNNLIAEYTIDITKAKTILGYKPEVDFEKGIHIVKHWLTHENGWQVIHQAMKSQ